MKLQPNERELMQEIGLFAESKLPGYQFVILGVPNESGGYLYGSAFPKEEALSVLEMFLADFGSERRN